MKKSVITILSCIMVLVAIISPHGSVSAYPGGLLDSKLLNYGPGFNTSNGTTSAITDNANDTSYTLDVKSAANMSINDNAFLHFSTVHTIGSYTLLTDRPGQPKIAFFNSSGTVIKVIDPVTDGTIQMIEPVSGVKAVYLSNDFSTQTTVYEFDVFDAVNPDAPILAAMPDGNVISLAWGNVQNATHYTVKRSTTPGGPYSTIATNVVEPSFIDSTVSAGIKYFYVVTATSLNGESSNSNEAIAELTLPGRAILSITMTNGFEKEYDLSMSQVDAFLAWYDEKDAGTGPARYAFTKTWNMGPFKSRTEYVIFDKILTFEVKEYDVVTQ